MVIKWIMCQTLTTIAGIQENNHPSNDLHVNYK